MANSTACGSSHHWSSGPAATFFLNESIAASSRPTYNTGVSWYMEFCRQRKWSPFLASESSLIEFVVSASLEVQYQIAEGISGWHQTPSSTRRHASPCSNFFLPSTHPPRHKTLWTSVTSKMSPSNHYQDHGSNEIGTARTS